MGHITYQYGPYYKPSPAPPRGRGAERLSHKAYKTHKSYKSHKTYKHTKNTPPPLGGIEGGLNKLANHHKQLWRTTSPP